jgi:type I restriction enzyme S subunit
LSNDFIGQLTACMRGANYPAVTDRDVMEAAIPVPHVSDQRRIAARIKECMERVVEIDKLRVLSDAESKILLRSFYRDLYCDLRAKHDRIALSTVGRVTGGGTPSKQNAAYWTGDIPWVSPKDMKRRDIDSAADNISEIALSASSAKLIETPSVLFVVRGMILAHTLPIAISRVPLAINQDMKAITPTSDYEVEYIAAMMRGAEPDLLHSVEVAGHGTRRLQTEHWQALPIPALPAKKQREVVAMVREIEATVDMLRDSCPLKEVGQLREAVLRKAFAGEL